MQNQLPEAIGNTWVSTRVGQWHFRSRWNITWSRRGWHVLTTNAWNIVLITNTAKRYKSGGILQWSNGVNLLTLETLSQYLLIFQHDLWWRKLGGSITKSMRNSDLCCLFTFIRTLCYTQSADHHPDRTLFTLYYLRTWWGVELPTFFNLHFLTFCFPFFDVIW